MCGCVRERNFAHGPVRCNTRDCSFRGAMNAWLGGSAPARTWTSWCSNALPPCATRSRARWNGSWTTSALRSCTWMNSMPGFVPGRSRNSSMQPIFEEIWFRFGEAEKEAKLLALALAYFKRRASAESAPEWKYLAIGGIASGMEKGYSGGEKTLQIIANDLDGPPPISGEGWARRLLDRMGFVVGGRQAARGSGG